MESFFASKGLTDGNQYDMEPLWKFTMSSKDQIIFTLCLKKIPSCQVSRIK